MPVRVKSRDHLLKGGLREEQMVERRNSGDGAALKKREKRSRRTVNQKISCGRNGMGKEKNRMLDPFSGCLGKFNITLETRVSGPGGESGGEGTTEGQRKVFPPET